MAVFYIGGRQAEKYLLQMHLQQIFFCLAGIGKYHKFISPG